jgi:serine/threonine protein kinase
MRSAVFRVASKSYESVREIGHGTCPHAWLARAEDNTEYALRISGLEGDQLVRPDQVVKEAGTSKTMDGPYFVKTLAAGRPEDCGVPVVVMELAERGSIMRTWGTMSLTHKVCIAMTLVLALKALHARELNRGDIKPSTVLVGSVGDVPIAKLGDFGGARVRDKGAEPTKCSMVFSAPRCWRAMPRQSVPTCTVSV